jgi:hypothetical protein
MRARLSALYGLSIYGALLLVVFGGLVIPAIIGSYLLIGVHEQKSARYALTKRWPATPTSWRWACRNRCGI